MKKINFNAFIAMTIIQTIFVTKLRILKVNEKIHTRNFVRKQMTGKKHNIHTFIYVRVMMIVYIVNY